MKKESVSNLNKQFVVIGSICLIAVILLLIFTVAENTKQQLVEHGTLECTELLTGYIVKQEATIQKEQTKVLIPVVSEGARVAKKDIIATYKGEEYKNYESTLADMDREILERMQELPAVYSSEVDAIEDTIYNLVKESIGETSYNKMQEYKQKVNSNISKRASIIGKLSPDGAQIKKLIDKRNEYEADAKKSNDNILATMPGIVSYTTDGLEQVLNYNGVKDMAYDTIKKEIDENKNTDNTKIKIVNNYEAYIVMKANLENVEHIAEGYNYRLRLVEQGNYELLGKLEKVVKKQDGIEVYFKITNGLEHIVNLREVEVEVVWDYTRGLIIPTEALNSYDNIQAYYVTVIKSTDYVKIPVKTNLKKERYAQVENYTVEEMQELGLDCEYKLKLYDRIIINTK